MDPGADPRHVEVGDRPAPTALAALRAHEALAEAGRLQLDEPVGVGGRCRPADCTTDVADAEPGRKPSVEGGGLDPVVGKQIVSPIRDLLPTPGVSRKLAIGRVPLHPKPQKYGLHLATRSLDPSFAAFAEPGMSKPSRPHGRHLLLTALTEAERSAPSGPRGRHELAGLVTNGEADELAAVHMACRLTPLSYVRCDLPTRLTHLPAANRSRCRKVFAEDLLEPRKRLRALLLRLWHPHTSIDPALAPRLDPEVSLGCCGVAGPDPSAALDGLLRE